VKVVVLIGLVLVWTAMAKMLLRGDNLSARTRRVAFTLAVAIGAALLSLSFWGDPLVPSSDLGQVWAGSLLHGQNPYELVGLVQRRPVAREHDEPKSFVAMPPVHGVREVIVEIDRALQPDFLAGAELPPRVGLCRLQAGDECNSEKQHGRTKVTVRLAISWSC
jgi:hypothetical protein